MTSGPARGRDDQERHRPDVYMTPELRACLEAQAVTRRESHKTASIYRRYAIVDEAMLREGSEKLAALHAGQSSGQSALKARLEALHKLAEGEGFEPPRASRPGGFQVPESMGAIGPYRSPLSSNFRSPAVSTPGPATVGTRWWPMVLAQL